MHFKTLMDAMWENRPMKTTKKLAPWVTMSAASRAQHKRLSPERSLSGGIKVRSTPERVRMDVYRAIKAVYVLQHPLCDACWLIHKRKPNWTDEIHHRRGRVGWLLVDVRYWTATCSSCHLWIHDNPQEAMKLKLLEKR